MSKLMDQWNAQKAGSLSKFRTQIKKLKSKKGQLINEHAQKTHDKVFSQLDCLDCANCCKSIPPIVSKSDSKRIAKHLNLSKTNFYDQYLTKDDDGDTVFNQSPCRFLNTDNTCEIYDVRPNACRAYPHTDNQQFYNQLNLHPQNAQYCPAVFHILKRMLSM